MDQASQVREKIDIVALISEYIPLKKMGRNFTTNCPFHNENSPSFVVSPERQIWHCFGCGKGGDAFSFLMEYENLEFIEALRILGKKAGIEIKSSGSSFSSSKKEAIFALNKLASEYYNYVLTKHKVGEKALEYLLKERGLNEKLIKTFNIGFSPITGDGLSNYLINKKNFKPVDLVEAGLSFQKGSRTVDFFRGRIMFPLTDHRSNIVGFSGRSVAGDDFSPKYINTRDTLVYHKGSMFFGLDLAREAIKKEGFSIVVEGEFDVISAFKEGVANVIALKGTALTENQAQLLSRFAPKVALCLDQDSAGMNAMKRSLPVLEKRALQISIIDLKEKDPDEAIRNNPVEFKKAVRDQVEVYDFLINKLTLENDTSSSNGKKNITDELLPLISSINNEIIKEHYLKKLSEKIDISYDAIVREVDKKETETEGKAFVKKQKLNRVDVLEEYLLALILQSTDPRESIIKSKDILTEYKFQIPAIGKIFVEIISVMNAKEFDIKAIAKNISAELLPVFDKCYLLPLPKFENAIKYDEEIIRVSKDIRVIYLKEKIKEISKNLKIKNSDEEIEQMKEEISTITSALSSS